MMPIHSKDNDKCDNKSVELSYPNRNNNTDIKLSNNSNQYVPMNPDHMMSYEMQYNNVNPSSMLAFTNFRYHPKKDNLRKGKWTLEEELYTTKIIESFNAGLLKLPESAYGITLRTYLAEKLCCDPMRITKKYTGASCLGKRVYHKDSLVASPDEIEKTRLELNYLEMKFLEKLEQLRRERRESESVLEEMYNQITISTPNIDAMLYQGRQIPMPYNQTHNIGYNYNIPSMYLTQHPGYIINSPININSNQYLHNGTHITGPLTNKQSYPLDDRGVEFKNEKSNNINPIKSNMMKSKPYPIKKGKTSVIDVLSNDKIFNNSIIETADNQIIYNSHNLSEKMKSCDSLNDSSLRSDSISNSSNSLYNIENTQSDGTTDETDSTDEQTVKPHNNHKDLVVSNNNSDTYMKKSKNTKKRHLSDCNNEESSDEDHVVASTLLGLFYDINKSSSENELVQFVEDVQKQQTNHMKLYADPSVKSSYTLKKISSTNSLLKSNELNKATINNKKLKRSHLSFNSLPFIS